MCWKVSENVQIFEFLALPPLLLLTSGILFFVFFQNQDTWPSSLALNTPVPVNIHHTSSTTSVPVNSHHTTTTTTTTSSTTSVLAPSPVTAPPSATAGGGGGVPTYLTDLYAIICYSLGVVLSLLSVVIFWIRKTCKSPRHTTSHNISLVNLSCPPPPPVLSPSLLSTNPFQSSSSV